MKGMGFRDATNLTSLETRQMRAKLRVVVRLISDFECKFQGIGEGSVVGVAVDALVNTMASIIVRNLVKSLVIVSVDEVDTIVQTLFFRIGTCPGNRSEMAEILLLQTSLGTRTKFELYS